MPKKHTHIPAISYLEGFSLFRRYATIEEVNGTMFLIMTTSVKGKYLKDKLKKKIIAVLMHALKKRAFLLPTGTESRNLSDLKCIIGVTIIRPIIPLRKLKS